MDNTFNPNWVSAPGDTILDFLEHKDITSQEFSKMVDLSITDVHFLLNGEYEITDELAEKLSIAFSISKQFWINRENTYRTGLKKGLKR